MKQLPFVLLTVASVAASAPVLAAEAPRGWYAGASVGGSSTSIKVEPNPGGFRLIDDTDWMWSLRGGYRFHENVALEAGYSDLGKLVGQADLGPPQATKISATRLGVLGIVRPTDRIEAFAKLGVASLHYRGEYGSDRETMLHLGIGASYALTRAVKLRADYDHYGPKTESGSGVSVKIRHQTLSLGLDYRF